jgi:KDO2-lipid IV(A) lauroyltransferase
LPLDCASALGGSLARRIGPFLGVSKHARRNIGRAFPELSEIEIARVVAGRWDNLGRVVAEYPHLLKTRVFELGGGSRGTASNMSIVRSQLAGG